MENGYIREDEKQLVNMPIGDIIKRLKEIEDIKLLESCFSTFILEKNSVELFNIETYEDLQLKTAIQIAIEKLERNK